MSEVKIDLNNLDKSNWKTYRFDEIAKNISERVDPNNTDLKVYIGLEHIDSESIHIKRNGTADDVNGQKLRFYPGDIIFGRRRAYQRKAGIATMDGFCSAHALVLRANPEVIDPQLFPFFLHSDQFMHRAVDISVGSLSPTINWGTLKHQEFFLPPKEQQAELAELLRAMDDIDQKNQCQLESLKQVYISFIEKKLFDKRGKKFKLSELGNGIRGVGYKPEELVEEYTENRCIILRANNISNSRLNFRDIKIVPFNKVKNNQFLVNGDFAICMSNGSKDLVGKAALYKGSDRNVSIGSFCAGFRPKKPVYSQILFHFFQSESYKQMINRTLSGSTINNLKISDIEGFSLRVNMSELSKVLSKLEFITTSLNDCENFVNCAKNLQKSLINQVL